VNLIQSREIRSWQAARVLPDLLQSIFTAELLMPSQELWLVSPWISDIAVIDNRTGEFNTIVPEWDRVPIRLSQVLCYLANTSAQINIATRDDEHSQPFFAAMKDYVCKRTGPIRLLKAPLLHEKGLLARDFYLSGSFNFTYYGITLNEEKAYFHIDKAIVAENYIAFRERWKSNRT